MAGTKEGGARAAITNKAKWGTDFYARIGKIGGHNGRGHDYTGGFADGDKGRERASIVGAIGGKKSRRGKKTNV